VTTGSKIEWCDHTFNPWWGCARVSPGCRFCYAERDARRYGHQVWGRHGPRRLLSEANWRLPLRWDRDAERAGVPALVFCASMADVFEDHPQVVEPRQRLWRLIEDTPHLRWLLLTKRPENVPEMVPWATAWPEQVWLGTSVETQRYALQRIPRLLEVSGVRVRFLSCEPLLGPLELSAWLAQRAVDWVIAGGESGPTPGRCTRTGFARCGTRPPQLGCRSCSSSGARLRWSRHTPGGTTTGVTVASSPSSTRAATDGAGCLHSPRPTRCGCAGSARAGPVGCWTAAPGTSSHQGPGEVGRHEGRAGVDGTTGSLARADERRGALVLVVRSARGAGAEQPQPAEFAMGGLQAAGEVGDLVAELPVARQRGLQPPAQRLVAGGLPAGPGRRGGALLELGDRGDQVRLGV
jgi:protein gp37